MISEEAYYGYVSIGESLCHHGVRGQAWGVTNGPPYPLGSAGKSRFSKMKQILGVGKSREAKLNDKANNKMTRANLNRKMTESKLKGVDDKNTLSKAKAGSKIKTVENKDAVAKAKISSKVKNIENKQALDRARHRGKTNKLIDKLEKQKFKTEMSKLKQEQRQNQGKAAKMSAKDAFKEKIINSGDPKQLKRYGKYLSNDEYRQAVNRIQLVRELKDSKMQALIAKGEKIGNAVKTTANTVQNGVDAYNNLMSILDRFAPKSDGTKRTKIGVTNNPDVQKILERRIATIKLNEINKDPEKWAKAYLDHETKNKGSSSSST